MAKDTLTIKAVEIGSKTEINKLLKKSNNLLQQSVDIVFTAQNCDSYNTNIAHKSEYSIDYIPHTLYSKSLKYYDKNNFALGLEQLFGTRLTIEVLQKFSIGTAKHPANSTIFWQIDTDWRIRTGKVILYDKNTLKRNKNNLLQQNQQRVVAPVVDWVHSRLMKGQAKKHYYLKQCLFGLHQLSTSSNTLPIGIVESEKTAVICSIYLPNMIWMATGGAQNLNSALLQSLDKRKIVLFPDVNQFEVWKEKGQRIQQLLQQNQQSIDIYVSDLLEHNATLEMKANGADLADILIKRDGFTGLALTDYEYPIMWDVG